MDRIFHRNILSSSAFVSARLDAPRLFMGIRLAKLQPLILASFDIRGTMKCIRLPIRLSDAALPDYAADTSASSASAPYFARSAS